MSGPQRPADSARAPAAPLPTDPCPGHRPLSRPQAPCPGHRPLPRLQAPAWATGPCPGRRPLPRLREQDTSLSPSCLKLRERVRNTRPGWLGHSPAPWVIDHGGATPPSSPSPPACLAHCPPPTSPAADSRIRLGWGPGTGGCQGRPCRSRGCSARSNHTPPGGPRRRAAVGCHPGDGQEP